MMAFDFTTVLVIFFGLFVLFLAVDFIFAGGGMTSAMMGGAIQSCGAALSSPYGWTVIVGVLLILLAALWILFGYR